MEKKKGRKMAKWISKPDQPLSEAIDGQLLMPTDRHGKVRHLLKDGRAEVVTRCPFTIIERGKYE